MAVEFKVYPKHLISIPDILPNRKRIEKVMTVELNTRELRRCLSFATVMKINGEEEILVTPENFVDLSTETATVEIIAPTDNEDSADTSDSGTSSETDDSVTE